MPWGSFECEAAGMRISTSKSKAMALDRKEVTCSHWVGGELLPQVEEFKYLGVLFMSEGRMSARLTGGRSNAFAVSVCHVEKQVNLHGHEYKRPK